MDEILIPFFVLLFFGAVLVLPVMAIVTARKAAREVGLLQARLLELETRTPRDDGRAPARAATAAAPPPAFILTVPPPAADHKEVEPSMEEPEKRPPPIPPVTVEDAPGPIRPAMPTETDHTARAPAVPPPLPADLPRADRAMPDPGQDAAGEPPAQRTRAARAASIEQFMGVKLFAWLGGVALFFGIVFFVKYAFKHDIIPPAMQVALGFVAGAGLLAGGVATHRKGAYRALAQAFCATGVLTLYGVSFAAHAIYDFAAFGPLTTFALMALITVTGFLIAVRLDALVVAILGMVGGFMTPALLQTGHDNPLGLFGYIALLDIGLLAVARHARWNFLPALAALGTVLWEFAWFALFFDRGRYSEGNLTLVPMGLVLFFVALFLLAAWWARRKDGSDPYPAASLLGLCMVAIGAAYVFLAYPAIAHRTFLLYGFVLLVNLAVLAVGIIRPRLGLAQVVVAGATFLHLAIWTVVRMTSAMLEDGLVVILLFGALHAAYPMVWTWLRPDSSAGIAKPGSPSVPSLTARLMLVPVPVLCGALPFGLLALSVLQLPVADPSPVFGVGLLFVILLLGFSLASRRPAVVPVALLCMLGLEAAWHFARFVPASPWIPLAWYLGIYSLFLAFPFVFRRACASHIAPWAASAFSGVGHFLLVYNVIRQAFPNDKMGLLPAAFAMPTLLGLLAVLRWLPRGPDGERTYRGQLAWFGGVALFFITLVFPIQFDRQWLTVSWALEGAALVWLFRRVPHAGLKWVGITLLGVSFIRLSLNPAVFIAYPRSGRAILNWHLYAYGVVAAAQVLGGWWLPEAHRRFHRLDLRAVLYAFGGLLLFLLLNIEIADFFTAPGERFIAFRFGGHFARDMTYSISWGLFSLALLVLGIAFRAKGARFASIGLLVLTLIKLFLHDLAAIDNIYRIGALVGVAVIAFVASFLYQRFFDRTSKP